MSRLAPLGIALLIAAFAVPALAKARSPKLPAAKIKRAVKEALRDELGMYPGEVQSMKIKGIKPLAMPGPAAVVEIGFRQNEDFVGKVPVNVRVMHDGKLFTSAWVTAEVRRTVPVVTASRRLRRGHVIRSGDVEIRQMDAARSPARTVELPTDVIGMQVRSPLGKGRPVAATSVIAPNLVERGALVTLVAGGGALRVTAPGRVEQSGPRNSVVRVTNLASNKVLHGRVVGRSHVLVSTN